MSSTSLSQSAGASIAESVSAGAAGGVALGSVIGLGIAPSSLLITAIGGAAGAIGGGILSYIVHRYLASRAASAEAIAPR